MNGGIRESREQTRPRPSPPELGGPLLVHEALDDHGLDALVLPGEALGGHVQVVYPVEVALGDAHGLGHAEEETREELEGEGGGGRGEAGGGAGGVRQNKGGGGGGGHKQGYR